MMDVEGKIRQIQAKQFWLAWESNDEHWKVAWRQQSSQAMLSKNITCPDDLEKWISTKNPPSPAKASTNFCRNSKFKNNTFGKE